MSKYCTVLAIDAGIRNLGWCLVDTQNWTRPLAMGRDDLWPNRKKSPSKPQVVRATCEWMQKRNDILSSADVIVLENQMRTPFIVQNACIQTKWLERVIVAHPVTVGSWWKLPRKREAKKQAGIKTCLLNGVLFPPVNGKQDDMADAWLTAVWALVKHEGLSSKSVLHL